MRCRSKTTQNGREMTVLIAHGVPNILKRKFLHAHPRRRRTAEMTVLITYGVPNVLKRKFSGAPFPQKPMIQIRSVSSDDHIPVNEDLSGKVTSMIMIKVLLVASMKGHGTRAIC